MHLDLQVGLVALSLLLAVATLLAIAPALRIPYPILLVVGGLALGVLPGMPEFELQPELVFFGVLPPLLYGAAFFTALRVLRASLDAGTGEGRWRASASRVVRRSIVTIWMRCGCAFSAAGSVRD